MAYTKLTLKELKSICKDNHLKNYSALNKTELIAFIKKNKKKKQNKKKCGGFIGVLNRDTLKNLLGNISEEELIEKTTIHIQFKKITTIEYGAFNGLLNLEILELTTNKISTIEGGAFNGLTNLKELDLKSNQITIIQSGTFNGLTNLQELHLSYNQIETIEPDSFNGLTNLKGLDLSYNLINTIELGIFNGLTSLIKLDLRINRITTIEHDTFNELRNLKELNLSNNLINTIELGIFNGLTKLEELDLHSNQITTIQRGAFNRLTSLIKLNLESNKINTIQPGIFNELTNLKNLYLNKNQITTIERNTFNGLTNLEYLYLRNNQITTIQPGAFNGLRSIERRRVIVNTTSMNERSRNYYSSFINPNPNITNITNIKNNSLITKNMLNTSKNNNKYHNHKLYNHILTIDDNTLTNIQFKFEGQTGINGGGLTRTVYDIFYHSYIKKFFEVNSNGSYYINKTKINDNNKENIITATDKLIILAKKGSVQIVIPIHETLMEILKSKNPTNTINLTKKNKYNDSNTLTNTTRKNGLLNQNSKISNVIAINNGNTTFKINWNNIKNNDTKENTKKEIFLRRYLNSVGFEKYTDFEYMRTWFKTYWNDTTFITKLSFTKKDFFKRIKIIKIQDGNKPRQEYELSSNNNSSNLINKFLNSNNGKQLIQEYPNLKVILDYINQEDDEYRKKFNKYITGSIYNNGEMKLLLINGNNTKKPIFGRTCSIHLDIYKINPNQDLKNHTTLTNNKFKIYVNEKTMSNQIH